MEEDQIEDAVIKMAEIKEAVAEIVEITIGTTRPKQTMLNNDLEVTKVDISFMIMVIIGINVILRRQWFQARLEVPVLNNSIEGIRRPRSIIDEVTVLSKGTFQAPLLMEIVAEDTGVEVAEVEIIEVEDTTIIIENLQIGDMMMVIMEVTEALEILVAIQAMLKETNKVLVEDHCRRGFKNRGIGQPPIKTIMIPIGTRTNTNPSNKGREPLGKLFAITKSMTQGSLITKKMRTRMNNPVESAIGVWKSKRKKNVYRTWLPTSNNSLIQRKPISIAAVF